MCYISEHSGLSISMLYNYICDIFSANLKDYYSGFTSSFSVFIWWAPAYCSLWLGGGKLVLSFWESAVTGNQPNQSLLVFLFLF